MKKYKKWDENEIALIRAAILNNVEDVEFLSKSLNRTVGSICCKLGRERMTLDRDPIYTGRTIGYNEYPKILI
jgi:hypothetical protein